MTGLTLPVTLAAGQSTTFNVTFTPQSGGAASGSLAIASNASNSNAEHSADGAMSPPPAYSSTSDSSLSFGSVPVERHRHPVGDSDQLGRHQRDHHSGQGLRHGLQRHRIDPSHDFETRAEFHLRRGVHSDLRRQRHGIDRGGF